MRAKADPRSASEQVQDVASEGVSGAAGRMPFFDQIQRAFGRHDISGIQAHTDPLAVAGAQSIGAAAYATGHHVAFGATPDLHTAAHEAAHVIQQRAGVHLKGGVGSEGDLYERHADEVADLVVQGKSAEALLDRYASQSGGSTSAVQCKLGSGVANGTPVVKHTHAGDEDHYVVEGKKGTQYVIRDTATDTVLPKAISPIDDEWGTQANRVASRRTYELGGRTYGHNYVSEDYKRINSLLGALERMKLTPEQIVAPNLPIAGREKELVKTYRAVAIERRCLQDSARKNWDIGHAEDTLRMFHRINDVWNRFPKKPTPDGFVSRGDTVAILTSFPEIDPAKNAFVEGENPCSHSFRWPGIMSTTVGQAKNCNLTAERKVLWQFEVPENHDGRILGNNQSENEATFPLGTAVTITGVIVRRTDKSFREGEFGKYAEVIVFARITSEAGPEPEPYEEEDVAKTGALPPPKPPGKGAKTAPSKLSAQQQSQLAILKRGLAAAEREHDEETAKDLREKIAAIEGPKLSVAQLSQLAILERGLAAAERDHDKETAEDLRAKIAALGVVRREPRKPAQQDEKPPLLTPGQDLVAVEDSNQYHVEAIIPGGAHGAWKLRRTNDGQHFFWKPAIPAGAHADAEACELMADAECGGTALANHIVGGYLVPRADRLTLNGQLGTVQPFITFKKQTFTPAQLAGKQAAQMVAHMIADWIISNHDNNDTQFYFDAGDNLIGIDKGQAYKHFSEGGVDSAAAAKARAELATIPDNEAHQEAREKVASNFEPAHLDPGYHPSGNFKTPSPKPFVERVLKLDKLPFQWDDPAIQAAICNAEALTVTDVEKFLAPYARRTFAGREPELYQAVVARAHRIQEDLKLIFGEHYTGCSQAAGHRAYQPELPAPARAYKGPELDELGKDTSAAKYERVTLGDAGKKGVATLLDDFSNFDHRGGKHHDGTLRQHSIYVANAVDYMFEAAEHPERFQGRQKGDEAAMYGDYVKNVPAELRPLLALTGFLHDAGKAGEEHLTEEDLTIGGKHAHPKEGFEMMLPTAKRDPVTSVSKVNEKRTDFDYHLRQPHVHAAPTFDFGAFFDVIKLDPKQRAIVQICTAMHYDFGGAVLKPLGKAPEPAQMERCFRPFLDKLKQITARTEYGAVDELLVNLVIAIGAADVLGAKQVIVAAEQQSVYEFPPDESKRNSGSDSFTEYGFKDLGRLVRLALLYYLKHGKVQAFDFAAAAPTSASKPVVSVPTVAPTPTVDAGAHTECDDAQFAEKLEASPIVHFELARYLRDSALIDRVVTEIGAARIRRLGTVTVATIVEAAVEAKFDIARIITAAREGGPWWRALVAVAQHSGVRAVAWELGGPMVHRDGDSMTVRARAEVVEAYLHDLPSSSSYLSVVEGEALARAWHVHARVYNQLAEPTDGSGIYVDTGSNRRFRAGKRTHGDGNCLIHAFSLLTNSQNANPAQVRAAREAIRDGADRQALSVQVDDLVRSVAENRPQWGIGAATRRLIDADPSVTLARAEHERAANENEKSKVAAPKENVASCEPSTAPTIPAVGPGRISFNVIYGEGESRHRGVLLFVNNNHYIVLEPIDQAQATASETDAAPTAGNADTKPKEEHLDNEAALAELRRIRVREALVRRIEHEPMLKIVDSLVDAVINDDNVNEAFRLYKQLLPTV